MRTDEDLCHDWPTTTRALSAAPLSRRMAVVRRRELLLAEMERRNPAGLQGWLESARLDEKDLEQHLAP